MMDWTSFSHGQIKSKKWLVQELLPLIDQPNSKVAVLAGWHCLTGFMLTLVSSIKVIHNYDWDQPAVDISRLVNNYAEVDDYFDFQTFFADINDADLSDYTVVINTSCEHMEEDIWFDNIKSGTIVALQGTDQDHGDEQYHEPLDLNVLIGRYPMSEILFTGALDFEYHDKRFSRYMIIGVK